VLNSLALFLTYLPRSDGALAFSGSRVPTKRTAVSITVASILHFVVMAVATFYLSLLHSSASTADPSRPPQPSETLVWWANFLGVQSTILASIQYVPQLYTTWRLKHVGSLSIPMMCIQTPGSFVWAVSLAMREGTRWSSWATYVVTGMLQGGLLVMCVMWEIQERRARKQVDAQVDTVRPRLAGERRPLLAGMR